MAEYSEKLTIASSMGGRSEITRSGDVKPLFHVEVAAALAVTQITGTTDRVMTVGSNHGITTQDKVGYFWTAGERVGMTVSATDATTVTVTASTGNGDSFPANSVLGTLSKAAIRDSVTLDLTTDLQLFSVECAVRASVNFVHDDGSTIFHPRIAAGECVPWAAAWGYTNPFSDTVASIECYNSSTSVTEVDIGILLT